MACFIVPLAQAVATTIYRRQTRNNENKSILSANLPRLETMLYGGSAMLIVDHIISGEVMPMFPFFSALMEEGGQWVMLREMLTVGVPMSIVVTFLWAVSVAISARRNKSVA